MRAVGALLVAVGAIGSLIVDIASSVWLYAEHGIGWVVAAWVLFVPLLVIPFLAGFGWWFIGAMGLTVFGTYLKEQT